MKTKRERRAENRVGGDEGMVRPREVGLWLWVAEPFPLMRSEGRERACCDEEEWLEGEEESADWMTRSRKGAQK